MPTLGEIQQNALDLRRHNQWAETSPERRFLFLVEEVGELARVLQDRAGAPATDGAEELFDVIWNVCDLANLLGIDLDSVSERKISHNHDRVWGAGATPNAASSDAG
ncbi:MazG nucleotide pyrophosphohydrolase domain-containing protein [Terrabacter aerolatus]|uniref:NTP pyrophosphohydrolase MazG-like domain-containing protein n=1 Tax=Terrabacter aerolatus TaxID=422442 RepID=A0A512D062_9MICO|nr:MazG nucleotide pyrophosphohydrolase domain-containing protein [Terrabacter aerolatus]GEO29854.1 hypothetical protein TAE01_16640 [Terrabacter aerolatus]